ncbi:hypothetical protein [Sphingomonas radiodurans]|uniref:hypothetical protein n=1 Tax=Sphingomonas radiodurans TaxID=2890321 RepID=UPI001E623C3F|nr:hypothetical protein [Sphingomonas radiodurans]WBH17737.1 hypothetical protein LLW23_06465 [Sphingomonas radiodurans]
MTRWLRTALLCLFAAMMPASIARAQETKDQSADVATIVDAISGEALIVDGMVKGLARSLDGQPKFKALEDRHPGFRAHVEDDLLVLFRETVRQRYPIVRPKLDALVRTSAKPDELATIAAYLKSSAGTRFLAAWGKDDETDLLEYWTRYTSSYASDTSPLDRTADAQFATSGALRTLASLNDVLDPPLSEWSDELVAEMKPRLPQILSANIARTTP